MVNRDDKWDMNDLILSNDPLNRDSKDYLRKMAIIAIMIPFNNGIVNEWNNQWDERSSVVATLLYGGFNMLHDS
jgi:hypothetical protein